MVARFFPARTVRHAEVDGLRVILDLRAGSYRVLDEAAGVLWAVLIGEADQTTSFEFLSQQYEVDSERLAAELAALADRCVREGLLAARGDPLLQTPPIPHIPGTRSNPGTLQALVCLIATRRALARHGFAETYERYAALPAQSARRSPERALKAFSRAENFFIARRAPQDCLLRSLALFWFLRLASVPVQHVIGVRRFPFGAHAWVEYNGSPLLDDCALRFAPLSRIGAV